MKALSLLVRWTVFIFATGLVATGNTQSATDSPPDDQTKAPDWLVWREFHESLQFYEKQSPEAVDQLLGMRAAIADAQRAGFMAAGRQYVQSLADIDSAARERIFSQYKDRFAPRAPGMAPPESLLRADAGEPSRGLLPATTKDGRSLRELLKEEGFIDAVDRERQAAFQAHLSTLRETLGDESLAKLEAWIAAEVAPKVSVVSVPAPPTVPNAAPAK